MYVLLPEVEKKILENNDDPTLSKIKMPITTPFNIRIHY